MICKENDFLEEEVIMNTVSLNEQTPKTMAACEFNKDICKKLPWSLALAVVPFIPDILDTIRSIPDQMAKNGYYFNVKHGQTEVDFNRADKANNFMNKSDENEKNTGEGQVSE